MSEVLRSDMERSRAEKIGHFLGAIANGALEIFSPQRKVGRMRREMYGRFMQDAREELEAAEERERSSASSEATAP